MRACDGENESKRIRLCELEIERLPELKIEGPRVVDWRECGQVYLKDGH
jgi:hypothetical protein